MAIKVRQTRTGERRYEVRLRDPNGREYSRTFRTRKEAETFQSTERADRARGSWIDPRRGGARFADVADEWLVSQPAKKPSSLARDRSIVYRHLVPALGDTPMDRLTPADVQRLVNRWTAELAARTVRRHYATLRAICSFAVDTDRIGRSPCRRIKLPEEPRSETKLITPEQVHTVAAAIDERSRPMVYLGAVLGLRWGEAAGLRVCDIDLAGSQISVETQLTRGLGGKMITGAPKWGSRRRFSLPEQLTVMLAEHIARFRIDRGGPEQLINTSAGGEALNYTNWRQRQWLPACAAAGIPGLTFHSLRTANATAMIALAVDVKTAQTRAGRKNALTTLNLYARATSEGDRDAARRLGDYFMLDRNNNLA